MRRRTYLESLGAGASFPLAKRDSDTSRQTSRSDDSDASRRGESRTEQEPNAATAADESTIGDPLAEMDLFDAHLHLIPTETLGRKPIDADRLVSWMDDNGVDKGVVQSLESPGSYPVLSPSWWVSEEVSKYPERLIQFFTIDPRTLVFGEDTVQEKFEKNVERGARGFGEFKPGLEVSESEMYDTYELCAQYDLPILFHSDDKAVTDDLGFSGLESVITSFPDVDFIGHGQGWWARISGDVREEDVGGYPERDVTPGGPVPRLLSEYDNIYGDISAGSGWNALTRDEPYSRQFLETHSDQLVFGTDYLSAVEEIPQFQLFDRFDLDRDAWADVRSRNLQSVLRE